APYLCADRHRLSRPHHRVGARLSRLAALSGPPHAAVRIPCADRVDPPADCPARGHAGLRHRAADVRPAPAARAPPHAGGRAAGQLALTLVIAQVALGTCNVFLGTPVWLSAAHLATAVVLLAVLLATTFRIARQRARVEDGPAIASAHTRDPAVGEMAR